MQKCTWLILFCIRYADECLRRSPLLSEEDSEEENKEEAIHGHVNSISVLRSYRRLGLAKKLMLRSREYIPQILLRSRPV